MMDNDPPRCLTQVRIAPTRLPERLRPRLARLAIRGAEVCRMHGAQLLAEICVALEISLLDLAASESRAVSAEARAHRAERDLKIARVAVRDAEALLAEARFKIKVLENDLGDHLQQQFEEPTVSREPVLRRPAPATAARSSR